MVEVELADVKIKRQVAIPLPESAHEIERPRVICSMRVFIGPKGVTESVTVAGCPDEFHQAVNLDLSANRDRETDEDLGEEPEEDLD